MADKILQIAASSAIMKYKWKNNLFVEAAKFIEAHRRFDILRREVDGFDLTTIGVGKIAA